MTVNKSFFSPTEKEVGSCATCATPGTPLKELLAKSRTKASQTSGGRSELPDIDRAGNTDPENRYVKRQMDSMVLGRVVEIVLDRRHPNGIIFDGVPYTMDEMRKLKGLDRDSLIAAHNIKREFHGEVQ